MKTFKTIDTYISSFPKEVQAVLEKMRETIRFVAPDASETIGYGIPTFKLHGKNLVHFGGFAKHVSFFPGAEAIEVFAKEISPYKTSKGTIQFSLEEPIPYSLIKTITQYRVKHMAEKNTK